MRRGFTLLEMLVATTLVAIAVVGLLQGITVSTRNAARLRDYDRAVQLGRLRMNELMVDPRIPRNVVISGAFDPAMAGGLEAGWRAQLSNFELPPNPAPGMLALDRLEVEIWWKSGEQQRTLSLEGYRQKVLKDEDIPKAAPQ
jgi:general secretion pathway protein I